MARETVRSAYPYPCRGFPGPGKAVEQVVGGASKVNPLLRRGQRQGALGGACRASGNRAGRRLSGLLSMSGDSPTDPAPHVAQVGALRPGYGYRSASRYFAAESHVVAVEMRQAWSCGVATTLIS